MPRSLRSVRLLLAASLVACASQTAGSGISTGSSRDPISFEEVQAAHAPNVHALVQRLRPNFLSRNRSQTDAGGQMLKAYVNDAYMGDAEALRQMSTDGVLSVQYLDPGSAQLKYGAGHSGGVILVTRR